MFYDIYGVLYMITMMKLFTQESKFFWYYTQSKLSRGKLDPYKNIFSSKPVMVVPGMGSTDLSTRSLRGFLQSTGLNTYGWEQGRNHGNLRKMLPPLEEHISSLAQKTEPVILIGWSLGGILSREIARKIPQHVKAVCCLGSPIVGGAQHTIYAPLYKRWGFDLTELARKSEQMERVSLSVPSHVIYSKNDAIVHWEACLDPYNSHTTQKEVTAPHFSLGFSIEVYQEIARWLEDILGD